MSSGRVGSRMLLISGMMLLDVVMSALDGGARAG
jgi:hypothetical protein